MTQVSVIRLELLEPTMPYPSVIPNSILSALSHAVRASIIVGVVTQSALAKPELAPSTAPFKPEMVQKGMCTPTIAGITDTTIQQSGLTKPSLWWIRDQIAAQNKYGRRLIDSWLACEETGETNRVDVMVNAQIWSLLDLLDRYEFIKRFGNAASDYGYNLRVFDPQGEILGAYTCNFNSDVAAQVKQNSTADEAIKCSAFDTLARTNFWSPSRQPLGF
ncbi:hypothetical protein H6F89_05295 [Cyanobacteria bacterium FACHB-63]|nr:hypothetical protein [Cyanobacteria bacterium FACHB-63]